MIFFALDTQRMVQIHVFNTIDKDKKNYRRVEQLHKMIFFALDMR